MRRLLLLLAFSLATLTAHADPYPKPTGYVDDFAQVLSPETTASLELQAADLHDKTRAQVFVVTIQSLDGADIKPFTNDLFHTWKIGEKGTDRGILILFVIADHKWRIEVGYGLEGILNDAKVGDIGRSMLASLKAADYDAAAQQTYSGVADVIAADAKVTLIPPAAAPVLDLAQTPNPNPDPTPDQTPARTSAIVVLLHIAFGFVILIVLGLLAGVRGSGRGGSSGFGGGSSSSSDSSSSSSDSSDSSSFSGGDGGDSGGGGADGSW